MLEKPFIPASDVVDHPWTHSDGCQDCISSPESIFDR